MNRYDAMLIGLSLVAFGMLATRKGRDIAETVAEAGREAVSGMKRGERLNNPGNIEHGEPWQGMAESQPDARFVAFVSPEYGFRAMAKIVHTYVMKYGARSVSDVINRWAPAIENPTGAYIRFVADNMGVDPNAPIDLLAPLTLRSLLRAIARFENGRLIWADDVIARGVSLA
jgi:hypothetical protein